MIKNFISAVKQALPWVWKAFVFTLQLVILTVAAVWSGIPLSARKIANDWSNEAFFAGFPTQWDRQLYYVLLVLAYITILAGWVVLSFTTVWIVNLII
jgi:hypothetical protein